MGNSLTKKVNQNALQKYWTAIFHAAVINLKGIILRMVN